MVVYNLKFKVTVLLFADNSCDGSELMLCRLFSGLCTSIRIMKMCPQTCGLCTASDDQEGMSNNGHSPLPLRPSNSTLAEFTAIPLVVFLSRKKTWLTKMHSSAMSICCLVNLLQFDVLIKKAVDSNIYALNNVNLSPNKQFMNRCFLHFVANRCFLHFVAITSTVA